ncbi:hypothetical protein PG996_003493 [Apiospora saccharicola]|uniref:Uncharacterized protein n=1 Tax=Apiospora saccharicola TaxID=335842 RepID=A0ABR1W1H6_9PEZI
MDVVTEGEGGELGEKRHRPPSSTWRRWSLRVREVSWARRGTVRQVLLGGDWKEEGPLGRDGEGELSEFCSATTQVVHPVLLVWSERKEEQTK